MSKRTGAAPIERDPDDQSLRGGWLLSFLDQNLNKFSKWVRISYQTFLQDRGESAVFKNGQLTHAGASVTAIRVWLERR
jgi:hypothetical protein